ncbi:MAG: M12 family metallopeptidase [Ilumatobacteraceae bacterium]
MPHTYKICSSDLPGDSNRPAPPPTARDQVAVDERVDNTRVVPLPITARVVLSGDGDAGGTFMARAAVERLKLWENGRTLRVKYLDGVGDIQTKVTAIAKEWEQVANLTLKFVPSGAADIRISFLDKGFSWSTVGTDAATVPSAQPTMNYGWLEPNTSTREYQRVVRHEFGHALGMIHEHQNPAAEGQIPWDKPKVYAYYAQQGWSKSDVDFNIFDTYAADITNHTSFDSASIMQYAVPDSLTVGSFAIGWNTTLSATDVEFMRRQYPAGATGVQELVADGARVETDLTTGGEVDTFHFDVPSAATHIMSTQGPSDTVLTLHGPTDPGAVLAWDDDRGRGTNARIVRKLQPGEYWLTVRHKDPTATGTYSVGLTTRKR